MCYVILPSCWPSEKWPVISLFRGVGVEGVTNGGSEMLNDLPVDWCHVNAGPLACAWAEYVRLCVWRGQNQKGVRGKRGCGGPKALAEAEPGEPKSHAWEGRE